MASSFESNETTLSEVFDKQLEMFFDFENSDLPSSSEKLQDKISSSIKVLEELTVSVSYLGLFSSNENIEEISTSSIKFLMLPVLLGALTLKLHKSDREKVLQIAKVYFKDFLERCNNYGLTNYTDPIQEDGIQTSELETYEESRQDLRKIGKQREEKIARYKKKKFLSGKLEQLKRAIQKPNPEEEIEKEYYLTMINHFICQSFDEMDSISMELNILQQIRYMNFNKENKSTDETKLSKPLRPFLIARDDVQKRVFGAGYPSLPIMTVEEFYEQRVKEGWFPSRAENDGCSAEDKPALQSKDEAEEQDEENIEKLRQRDDWRDTHRRGWGNTYNRS